MLKRFAGRSFDQIRPLSVNYDIFPYAAGSVLFHMGNTKILCSVTLQPGVPHFLRGKKLGWLTAEYALLPASTHVRSVRESSSAKRNGRAIEISRLIGRALRSVVNFEAIPEQTITIDCDVLQADGGTRTASISAACLALKLAQERWYTQGIIAMPLLKEDIAGISVGCTKEGPLVDMDFAEDSSIDADFNFVLTRSLRIVEIQGSAERFPLAQENYERMYKLAQQGITEIFSFYDNNFCGTSAVSLTHPKQVYESYDVS